MGKSRSLTIRLNASAPLATETAGTFVCLICFGIIILTFPTENRVLFDTLRESRKQLQRRYLPVVRSVVQAAAAVAAATPRPVTAAVAASTGLRLASTPAPAAPVPSASPTARVGAFAV